MHYTQSMNFAASNSNAPKSDREAISLIIDGLIASGCTMHSTFDGDGTEFPYTTKEAALDVIMSCDDGHLYVTMPEPQPNGNPLSFIYFVLGNDPEEVVCDHGVSLSKYLDPIVDPWWN